jgi:hypothetical protein
MATGDDVRSVRIAFMLTILGICILIVLIALTLGYAG